MCNNCQKKPVYEFTNQTKLCKNCFFSWFERKFLYTIRKFNLINYGEKVFFKNSGSFRDAVLGYLLKDFERSSTCKLEKNSQKVVLSNTLDIEARTIINSLFNGKGFSSDFSPIFEKNSKIFIKPFYLFLDKEVLLYANLKKLKFKNEKEKLNKFENLIEDLEKKHPEIKQAIIQSYLKMN